MPPRTDVGVPDVTVPSQGHYTMRQPCGRCGTTDGYVERRATQDVVRCANCGRHVYNAPRTETGAERASLRSQPKISPSQRSRILRRDSNRCVYCGNGPAEDASLHIGHLVSVHEAPGLGLTEADTWHDENLVAMCAECNLGVGKVSVSARLIAALVASRAKGKTT